MNQDIPKDSKAGTLREQAEKRLEKRFVDEDVVGPEETGQRLHELRVHQIELEMQNEELRRTQQELEAARTRYFDLYDMAPVGYFTVSDMGTILEANLTAAVMLGVDRGRLPQQLLSHFIFSEDQDLYYLHRKKLIESGDPQSFELRMLRKDGDPFWVVLKAIRTQRGDNNPVFRMTVSDIGDRKIVEAAHKEFARQAEVTLMDFNRSLTQSVNDMTIANKDLEAFSYSVSHDLRNPLNAITTNIEVLALELGPGIGSDARTALDYIIQASHRMAQVITDLMVLSGISRRKRVMEEVDLSALVRSFIAELKDGNPAREVRVDIQAGIMVKADPGLMRILLENFIRNAWKFTSKQKQAHIEFGEMEKEGRHGYFIRDNGIGFDMKEAGKLFKPYQRLHHSADYKGSGIGLAIAKRIVEKHNGIIRAEGEKDKGATFFFTLG